MNELRLEIMPLSSGEQFWGVAYTVQLPQKFLTSIQILKLEA